MVKVIAISNPGSVVRLVQPLLGNNVETTIVMEALLLRGLLAEELAIITEVINKVVMGVRQAEGLLLGSNSKTPHQPQAVSMVDTVDTPVGMAMDTEGSKAWALPRAWEAVQEASVLRQVLELYSRTTGLMALLVVLHLHLLRMTYLHQ